MHAGVLEFVPDQSEAEKQDAKVVFGAGFAELARAFGAGAFRGERLGREGKAEVDVTLGNSGVVDAVEEPKLDRAHPPYVVEVKAPVGIQMADLAADCRRSRLCENNRAEHPPIER